MGNTIIGNIRSGIKNTLALVWGNVSFMDVDWKNEDNGLCMNLFK